MTFQDPQGGRDSDTPPFLPPGSHGLCPECHAMPSLLITLKQSAREEGGHDSSSPGWGAEKRKYQNTSLLPWQQEEVGQFPLCEGWGGQGQSVAKGQHCLACGIYSATEPCDNLWLRGVVPTSTGIKAEAARVGSSGVNTVA